MNIPNQYRYNEILVMISFSNVVLEFLKIFGHHGAKSYKRFFHVRHLLKIYQAKHGFLWLELCEVPEILLKDPLLPKILCGPMVNFILYENDLAQ